MIPYDEITQTADRRWTYRLLERLDYADLSNDELEELVSALQAVSDPRSIVSLERMLCDTDRPIRIREAAGDVLRNMHDLVLDVSEELLRRWWHSDDDVLRRHALLCMDKVDCPDIVLQVACDPAHQLHVEALGRMQFYFEEPEHEKVKIAGLSHPDARVRAAAATVLLWDEPLCAEAPLIQATRDPVPEVALEAAYTLQYYPSLRVIRCLYDLRNHLDETVHGQAQISLDEIRDAVRLIFRYRNRLVASHIRRWLGPVWDLLSFSEEELRPAEKNPTPRQDQPRHAMPLAELLALLTDPDASPRILGVRLWNNIWLSYSDGQRRQLRSHLVSHTEALVRERASCCFDAWKDVDALRMLAVDPDFLVRKSAIYHLGQMPPTPGVADLAWGQLQRPETLGVFATEALETFVKHADGGVAIQRLGVLAGDHGICEAIRVQAVDSLRELGAANEIEQLAGQLLEPPQVTWALHIALLRALTELELPLLDIAHLREVDNLYVQEAVAQAVRGREERS
jgi:HEAT repeat protein